MNIFEFFSLIYLLLDHSWQESKDDDHGAFLGAMNPYLWASQDSGDPAVYEDFKHFMQGKTLGEDNGFQLAKDYLKTITFYPGLEKYLEEYDQEGWDDAMRQLLSQPHKGQDGIEEPKKRAKKRNQKS